MVDMSKSKKKRNKPYRGADAKRPDENVVRVRKVAAVVRSDRAQWLHDHRKLIKNVAIVVGIVIVIVAGIVTLVG